MADCTQNPFSVTKVPDGSEDLLDAPQHPGSAKHVLRMETCGNLHHGANGTADTWETRVASPEPALNQGSPTAETGDWNPLPLMHAHDTTAGEIG